MKTLTTMFGVMAFATGLLGASACGGSGCGAPEADTDAYAAPPPVQCPAGTVQNGTNGCSRVQTNNGTANTRTAAPLSTSGN